MRARGRTDANLGPERLLPMRREYLCGAEQRSVPGWLRSRATGGVSGDGQLCDIYSLRCNADAYTDRADRNADSSSGSE